MVVPGVEAATSQFGTFRLGRPSDLLQEISSVPNVPQQATWSV